MTEPSTDQVRELIAAAVAHAPGPHAWSEVERRAVEAPAPPSGPSRRPMVWLAAAATVGLLVAGVVVLSDDDSGTIRTDTPTTVSDQTTTTSTEPSPTTTIAAAGDPRRRVGSFADHGGAVDVARTRGSPR